MRRLRFLTMTDDFIAFLRRHRSIRRYQDQPVPDEDVRRAVEAGQSASTSSAVQSYCIIRVRDEARREQFIELTGGQPRVANCGAFFIICGDVRRHRLLCERVGKTYDARLEAFLLAVIDATLFAQNFVLAFESMGYGVCYIGGLRNRLTDVDAIMNFPRGVYPLYGLCVGVPDEQPIARPRLPLEAVLFEEQYPEDDAAILNAIDQYDERYRQYVHARSSTPGSTTAARVWGEIMAEKFSVPQRTDLAAFYASKGADLS